MLRNLLPFSLFSQQQPNKNSNNMRTQSLVLVIAVANVCIQLARCADCKPSECVFPFKYRAGGKDYWYETCTEAGSKGSPWCSTDEGEFVLCVCIRELL